ncbi:MAG: choice-of-anchor Q domain-containing protein [Anaerolineae bacterium]
MRLDTAFPPRQATVDHNLIDGFRGYGGELHGDDYVEGDPRFFDAPAGDLHLRALSPAIDRATALDAPPEDMDGQPRPQGLAYDIGADEHYAVDAVYLPLIRKQR